DRLDLVFTHLAGKGDHAIRRADSIVNDRLPDGGIGERYRVAQVRQDAAAESAVAVTHAAERVVVQLTLGNDLGAGLVGRRCECTVRPWRWFGHGVGAL